MIEVLKPGTLTTVQSRPRIGWRHRGVPSGGAADPLSLALANRLVGNSWDAPALEATLIGPELRFESACSVAIAGGRTSAKLNRLAVNAYETISVRAGDSLAIGPLESGARCYVAIAGGLDAESVFGSSATNLQAGFGGHDGRALAAGDRITGHPAVVEPISTPTAFRMVPPSSPALRSCKSAEFDLLRSTAQQQLFERNWVVGQRADRMGIRLEGDVIGIESSGRMPSSAVFPGTVQCPEDGVPYLLSIDAGTVGGYPRIAQVARLDRHLIGQLRPGDHVRFVMTEPDDANEALRRKHEFWRAWLPEIEEII